LKVTPKLKRNLARIFPFGVIWLITGWVFLLTEELVSGHRNLNPETAVNLTLPVFLFASIAVATVGWLVGLTELVFFEKRFRNYGFSKKVALKFLIYLLVMLVVMMVTFPIAESIETGLPIYHGQVINKTGSFFGSLTFLNTALQLSFQLLLSLIYSAVSESLGHQVLLNFITGKYHMPQQERRIFMFLDMKDSTTIAEQLGHIKYFKLLRDYYDIMSDAIINSYGEVYQYIGDEVVIAWPADKGFEHNHCIQCFNEIKQCLQSKAPWFHQQFGLVPDFKAGLHVGEVTAGEIGALKKEIMFTGDVLNTTARIQGLCKEYQTDLIVSQELLEGLGNPDAIESQFIGPLQLKGKKIPVALYSVKV
jgi:adenylate cyclase